MKIPGGRRLVARKLSRRVVAAICAVFGIFAVNIYDRHDSYEPSSFVVKIPFKPVLTIGDRDTRQYNYGGEVRYCTGLRGVARDQCFAERDDARKFIYDHWRSKQKGYIVVHFPCVDCSGTSHIFVDSNEKGDWQITTLTADRDGMFRQSVAYAAEYKRADEIEETRESQMRVLSFFDKNGRKIDSF
jgi:hypothetical protein